MSSSEDIRTAISVILDDIMLCISVMIWALFTLLVALSMFSDHDRVILTSFGLSAAVCVFAVGISIKRLVFYDKVVDAINGEYNVD